MQQPCCFDNRMNFIILVLSLQVLSWADGQLLWDKFDGLSIVTKTYHVQNQKIPLKQPLLLGHTYVR